MEVLFNYKRTVEDFKRCNGKAGNPYNFPFVSDCVASTSSNGPCKESETPVPCGDGTCRSDYVTCLRALSDAERRKGLRSSVLWAFAEYADALEERGLPRSEADAAILEAASGGEDEDAQDTASDEVAPGDEGGDGDDALVRDGRATRHDFSPEAGADVEKWQELGDKYMKALFGEEGKDDRSAGVALPKKDEFAGAPRAETKQRGSSAKLGPSFESEKWGGELKYGKGK
jgi:hypothetical protein